MISICSILTFTKIKTLRIASHLNLNHVIRDELLIIKFHINALQLIVRKVEAQNRKLIEVLNIEL